MDTFSAEAIASRNDEERFNSFAQKNAGFIKRTAFFAMHRFVSESDDEWAISLTAFYEAVQTYDESKGSFKTFASLVIKRRLLDYRNGEMRHSAEISVAPWMFSGENEEEDLNPIAAAVMKKNAELTSEHTQSSNPVRDEIEAVSELLGHYGFSFFDLTECSPKAAKTKQSCAVAVRALLESKELFDEMRRTKSLPVKKLCDAAGITRKILERHRKYIIAAAEILNGEYPLLAEYMIYIRKTLKT